MIQYFTTEADRLAQKYGEWRDLPHHEQDLLISIYRDDTDHNVHDAIDAYNMIAMDGPCGHNNGHYEQESDFVLRCEFERGEA